MRILTFNLSIYCYPPVDMKCKIYEYVNSVKCEVLAVVEIGLCLLSDRKFNLFIANTFHYNSSNFLPFP